MPNEERKKVREKLRNVMEIRKELLKSYSRITAISNEDVWIENYKSILEYDDNLIRLGNNICIYGQGLKVEEITADDILIIGKIKICMFMVILRKER